ncbi:hypothetical protein [Desulfuribacillus alkaliarsenatis]|uniref:Uncharacterized protein n=1 Tax=Desulfuribacillus alkaliarsenatis TaxID=766136 RepID=A0A1E5G050_9FIRM|nr:hypothetical protein [Desulfuribacillus alkaliarsenatis]OEF96123.1 hypothetical protein BHF68_10350 [Desulfuribacillus alkaliarsenatis]
MKKTYVLLTLILIIIIVGCSSNTSPLFKGFYQSDGHINGYFVQVSIQPDNNSFTKYIDNREVDKGTYKQVENNVYEINTAKQNFELTLNDDNSFEIVISKLNNGEPILLKRVSSTPTTFPAIFNDVDEYKDLLGSKQ